VKQEHINEWWGAIHAAPEWEVQPQFEERNLFAQVEAVKWMKEMKLMSMQILLQYTTPEGQAETLAGPFDNYKDAERAQAYWAMQGKAGKIVRIDKP